MQFEIKGGALKALSKEEILALATFQTAKDFFYAPFCTSPPVRNAALAVKAVADNKEDAA